MNVKYESGRPRGTLQSSENMISINMPLGVFQVMVPFNHTEFIGILNNHVNNKLVPMSRIDDAVRRILRVKFTMGLFENPLADQNFVDQLGSQVLISYCIKINLLIKLVHVLLGMTKLTNYLMINKQAHRDLAREAVRKSLVLLKNGDLLDKPVLPLPKNSSRILVAGTHANNLGYQCGGWSVTWQGVSGNNYTSGTPSYCFVLGCPAQLVPPSFHSAYLIYSIM